MILVRRAVWPLREVIGVVLRDESDLIQRGTRIFLRDVHDHTIQVAEVVESFRDVLTGLQDLYLSNLSHRMNEVMKVLTVISTIFVPLTFVAGVWGMNFQHMPELEWRWGYLGAWVVFVAITVMMLGLLPAQTLALNDRLPGEAVRVGQRRAVVGGARRPRRPRRRASGPARSLRRSPGPSGGSGATGKRRMSAPS